MGLMELVMLIFGGLIFGGLIFRTEDYSATETVGSNQIFFSMVGLVW